MTWRIRASRAVNKDLSKLIVHDRLANGSLGIVGITLNSEKPRIAEPELPQLWYPALRKAAGAPAQVAVASQGPLVWQGIESAMLGGRLSLAGQPIFRLTVGNRPIDSSQFTIAGTATKDATKTITANFRDGETVLAASLTLRQVDAATTSIALELKNAGAKPLTAALQFPTVASLRLGDQEDTWYLAGRRGGVISNVESRMHDEIGEAHPLALDGFFNPRLGAGLSFMPRVELRTRSRCSWPDCSATTTWAKMPRGITRSSTCGDKTSGASLKACWSPSPSCPAISATRQNYAAWLDWYSP